MKIEVSAQELRITADAIELQNLGDLADAEGDKFDSISTMCDVFEFMVTDRGFEWVCPDDTGDLTDAPMLGILGDEGPDSVSPFGRIDTGTTLYTPILWRWGFMDYALVSPQRRLLDDGHVVFVSGVPAEELYGQLMRPDCTAAMVP